MIRIAFTLSVVVAFGLWLQRKDEALMVVADCHTHAMETWQSRHGQIWPESQSIDAWHSCVHANTPRQ